MTNTTYYIATMTSDKFAAGTDANVYCQLIGEKGHSAELYLHKSLNHMNKFERARTDVFRFRDIKSLGDLTELRIWHDNSGPGAGWHLDKVEVSDEGTGRAYLFHCGAWLAKDEKDGEVDRTLKMSAVREKHLAVEDDDDAE